MRCTFHSSSDCADAYYRCNTNRYSEELKSEMARRLNYFVPQGLRWITQPIFGYIFDKKILNLDTEHLKQVRTYVVVS